MPAITGASITKPCLLLTHEHEEFGNSEAEDAGLKLMVQETKVTLGNQLLVLFQALMLIIALQIQ